MKLLINIDDEKLDSFQLQQLINKTDDFIEDLITGDYPVKINKQLPSYDLLSDIYEK